MTLPRTDSTKDEIVDCFTTLMYILGASGRAKIREHLLKISESPDARACLRVMNDVEPDHRVEGETGRLHVKPHLDPHQACNCARPLPSGRFYGGWEVCRLCRLFIVDASVRRALEAENKRRMRAAWKRRGGIMEKLRGTG